MCIFVVLLILSMCKLSESEDNGCWPWNIVLFDLDPIFAQDERLLIQGQMRHISERSCIRFVNIQDNSFFSKAPKKQLNIRKSGDGFCRMIWEKSGGASPIVLTIELGSTCTTKRAVLHELMHTLGFKHEHQRVDRKCYVRVFPRRVTRVGPFSVEFDHPDNDWMERFPYDKASIMHYSRSNKMKARDERWNEWEPLGNADGYLTWWDVWKINYKHCSFPHYCDFHPQQCAIMDSHEKSLGCKRS